MLRIPLPDIERFACNPKPRVWGIADLSGILFADTDPVEVTNRMARKDAEMFEVFCPDCGATLKVDPETRSVIAHTPAPRKRTFEDFEAATRALREQEERKESLFRQSVDAEKNKGEVLSKKFAEALKKAKETPDTGKPLRDFDLD